MSHLRVPAGSFQVERLYTGPQDSDIAEHMRACNPKGPLVVHIAKLFPKSDCSAFDAFGRILSGTIKRGDRARSSLLWLECCIWACV
jgi:116 kDa U5 small nuclear ribonucleoprotein component